jgi:hypothetical protein
VSARYAAPRGNKYAAPCRVCGQTVAPGQGHYSRTAGVIHAPSRWVGSPISGQFVGGCPKREDRDDAQDSEYLRELASCEPDSPLAP